MIYGLPPEAALRELVAMSHTSAPSTINSAPSSVLSCPGSKHTLPVTRTPTSEVNPFAARGARNVSETMVLRLMEIETKSNRSGIGIRLHAPHGV